MTYSQKPLIELVKAGKTPGETTIPKHIETVISNVFVFENLVYKVYKNDNDFFNQGFRDISTTSARFDFTRRDFTWNQTLSPSIYLELRGVEVTEEGEISFVEEDQAEELVMVMNRVEANDVLFEKIVRGEIEKSESFTIGKQLATSLKKVQKSLSEKFNFYEVFGSRIRDLRAWIKSAADYISEEESGKYCDFLEDYRNKNREWFLGELTQGIVVDGDFHSHNASFFGNTLYLMDTFVPKEEWGVGHQFLPLYRIGVDVWVLTGDKSLFKSFVEGYESEAGLKVDRKLDIPFVIYVSAIMVSYLYMLQKTDPTKKESAERFHKFLRDYFENVQAHVGIL